MRGAASDPEGPGVDCPTSEPLSGTSQEGTVPSRAPLGGGNPKQFVHADSHGLYLAAPQRVGGQMGMETAQFTAVLDAGKSS